MGKAFVYSHFHLNEVKDSKTDDPESELELLQLAKAKCLIDLEALIGRAHDVLGEENAIILKGQFSMLNDPSLIPPMEQMIHNERWTAETAIRMVTTRTMSIFEKITSEYMRERAADVRDVGSRLLMHVRGRKGDICPIFKKKLFSWQTTYPSDTVQLDKRFVLGVVTRTGGKTSHTAILANSLGIAAILGVGSDIDQIQDGDLLAMTVPLA